MWRMSYSLDFRRKVLLVREQEGLSIAQVAKRFGVGVSSVVRWLKDIHPKPAKTRKRKIDLEALAQDVRDYPDDFQYERAQRFGVTQKAIWGALKKLRVTYKKNAQTSQSGRRRTACLPGSD